MPNFIQLTTPLILHADPILPSHAATKQYVDNKRNSVSASAFTIGLITVARMPALTGDVTSVAGSGVINLNTNGVTAGSYAKVTVDATGRVTAGGALVAADIATVSWTKITSGKPTTAAGYGITNLVTLSGGTASGNITSTATPSAALHAVTKGYVDNAISAVVSASLSVGDVLRKTAAVAPSGFLRCNGAIVNKADYTSLYTLLAAGQITTVSLDYTSYSALGASQPWRQQYDINTTQSTDITGWASVTSLPATIDNSQVITTKNRVFLLGGRVTGVSSSAVYTAVINSDSTIGAWSASTSLPGTIDSSQAIITKNRAYLLGGIINGVSSSVVYTALINVDGTLGGWTTYGSLPGTVSLAQAFVTKNRAYLLGGIVNGTTSSVVYTAAVNTDGTLGTWTTGTALPATVDSSHVIVTKNRIFLLGGRVAGVSSSAVYTAPINTDGTIGAWVSSTSLLATTLKSQAVVTKNRAYLLGGIINGGTSSAVYTAVVNTDGTLGTWTIGTALGVTVDSTQAIVTRNNVYLLGGQVNGTFSSAVYTATVTGGLNDYTKLYDGSVNKFDSTDTTGVITIQSSVSDNYLRPGAGRAWEQQYMTGALLAGNIASSAGTSFPISINGAQALVTKNRAYIMGGRTASTTFIDTIYQASVDTSGNLGTWTDNATYVNSVITGSASMAILASAKTVSVTAKGADATSSSTSTALNFPGPANVSGNLPINVSSWSITAKGGEGWYVVQYRYDFVGWPSGSPYGPPSQPSLTVRYPSSIGQVGWTYYANSANVVSTGIYDTVCNFFRIIYNNEISTWGSTAGCTRIGNMVVVTDGTGEYQPGSTNYNSVQDQTFPLTKRDPWFKTGDQWPFTISPVSSTVFRHTYNTGSGLVLYADYQCPNLVDASYNQNGQASTFVMAQGQAGEVTYTFPGGVGQAATFSTVGQSGMPGLTTVPYSFYSGQSGMAPGSASMTYIQNTTTSGANTTFTLNGTILTFPGATFTHTPAVTSTQSITLPGTTALTATYSVASGANATVRYLDYTTSITNGTVLPVKISNGGVVVTRNRVYVIGGNREATPTTSVYTCTINTDGTLASWTAAAQLPGNVNPESACLIITSNVLHLFGGRTVSGSTPLATAYSAPINADGTLGTWTQNANVPATMHAGACFTTSNRLYVLPGFVAGSTSTAVYMATINTDGSLGAWTTPSNLPSYAAYGKAYVSKNTVYVFAANNTNTMYYATINADGTIGTWTTGSAVGFAAVDSSLFSVKSKLYLVGGGVSQASSTSVATFAADNSISDYTSYYNGAIVAIGVDQFMLPDFSAIERSSLNYFIKF